MRVGDIVSFGSLSDDFGIVVYMHPTKGVVQVYRQDIGLNWESCAKLAIVASLSDCV